MTIEKKLFDQTNNYVRLTPEMRKRVRTFAFDKEISKSDALRLLIQAGLDALDKTAY